MRTHAASGELSGLTYALPSKKLSSPYALFCGQGLTGVIMKVLFPDGVETGSDRMSPIKPLTSSTWLDGIPLSAATAEKTLCPWVMNRLVISEGQPLYMGVSLDIVGCPPLDLTAC